MCQQNRYIERLAHSGLGATANRIKLLETIDGAGHPLSAQEIYEITGRSQRINRVTVCRLLDLLVEKNLIEKMDSGERTLFYATFPRDERPLQPHFYCTGCGNVDCIDTRDLNWHRQAFEKSLPGRIDTIDIRLEGLCQNCLKHDRKTYGPPKPDTVRE